MRIEDAQKDSREFHGIAVKSGKLPELFHGMSSAYFIQGDKLYKTEPDFLEKVRPLEQLSRNGSFHFQMGRNTLSKFYYDVLPRLQEIADITEADPEKFRKISYPGGAFCLLSGYGGGQCDLQRPGMLWKKRIFCGTGPCRRRASGRGTLP